MAASNAAWQVSAGSSAFNPLGSFRLLSPLCPEGTEATSCASFSGNTAVVVSVSQHPEPGKPAFG
jgi:hypothetical protein